MKKRPPGFALAALASGLLVTAGLIAVSTGLYVLVSGLEKGFEPAIKSLLSEGGLPLVIYLLWALTIFGTVASLIVLALYRFREPWFWKVLLLASALFLLLPPIHTLLGLVSLVMLLRFRRVFEGSATASTAAFNDTVAYKES